MLFIRRYVNTVNELFTKVSKREAGERAARLCVLDQPFITQDWGCHWES
jgi:hypothetical protein